jgi:hypothetical protein
MRTVGRNDPCPCGSGRKHKRCCLDLGHTALRLATDLEARVLELGDEARRTAPEAWRDAFERCLGPVGRFGTVVAEEAAWLDTWLVFHEPLAGGRTAIDATAIPQPADQALRRSAICGWWARGADFPLDAEHWRSEEPATLHTRHEPFGTLHEGALIVARGVDAGFGHVALVGRPVVVADEVADDVLALLRSAPDHALCAALRWPEERTHTAEGEVVRQHYRSYEVAEPDAAIVALRSAENATEQVGVVCMWEDDVAFKIHGPPPALAVSPAAEPGVVWDLCEEDRADPPVLGEAVVSYEDADITLSAPTPARLRRLLDALPVRVTDLLGEVRWDDLDVPEVLSRVRRERRAALV